MGWVLAVAVGVAVVAVVALVVTARRLDAASRTLAAVGESVGSTVGSVDVVTQVQALVSRAQDAEGAVGRRDEVLARAPVGVMVVAGGGAVEFANDSAGGMLAEAGGILRTRVAGLTRSALASGAIQSIEMDVHDPERRVLSMTAFPLTSERDHVDACVYIEDKTEQRRLDAVRTDFVANASHELKTPLGGLSLLAETLMDAEDEVDRARLSDQIRREAQRMARVVDDVIRLAETEALGAEHNRLSVSELMVDAVDIVRELASKSHIELVDRGLADAEVLGDRSQLVSAIKNLLDNAIVHTAVKGEPGSVEYSAEVEGDEVRVVVADSGIGIPARYRDRVFERFFRVDRARSRVSGGTGLGLSIVRNVAVAHGGSVSVASKVGVGSTFTIFLPLAAKVATP